MEHLLFHLRLLGCNQRGSFPWTHAVPSISFPRGTWRSFAHQFLLFGSRLHHHYSCSASPLLTSLTRWVPHLSVASFGLHVVSHIMFIDIMKSCCLLHSFPFHIATDSHCFALFCWISNHHQQSEINIGECIDLVASKGTFVFVQSRLWSC